MIAFARCLWSYLHTLSVDTIFIVIGWHALIAKTLDSSVVNQHVTLLGTSTWLAYTANRWLDGWRMQHTLPMTFRHRFFIRWRWPFFTFWALILFINMGYAYYHLAPVRWYSGLILLLICLLYTYQVQKNRTTQIPKEFYTSGILTLGIFFFLDYHCFNQPIVVALVFLSTMSLFSINCCLIAFWEQAFDQAHQQHSIAIDRPHWKSLMPGLWVITLSSLFLLYFFISPDTLRNTTWAIVMSCALLLSLTRINGFSKERLHQLADLSLLTPFCFL